MWSKTGARVTLTLTYRLGDSFRRTVALRCYVAGTSEPRGGAKMLEINLNGGVATLCPALQFRDGKDRVVDETEYFWTIPVVQLQHRDAARAPAEIGRAAMLLALGKD